MQSMFLMLLCERFLGNRKGISVAMPGSNHDYFLWFIFYSYSLLILLSLFMIFLVCFGFFLFKYLDSRKVAKLHTAN